MAAYATKADKLTTSCKGFFMARASKLSAAQW